ncbi:Gfo/Idh/MocA family oxidoreductase, partial [Escherichia coli]|nr:Gfo/Idh/MocA family oxidoreductase [Escherichia coli]
AFGIPLYTSPEQITRMPDIACIVVRSTVAGGTGTQLARHFLTRGVHVIQEHPLHPDDISSLHGGVAFGLKLAFGDHVH